MATVSGGVAAAAAQASVKDGAAVRYDDFYRFQKRDRRQNALLDLRKNFEQDRKRLNELRATRRFKPY